MSETMRSLSPTAYTLVELLIALALSLLVLLAVTELFSRVGGTMNDTRSAMGTSANLHEAAMLLRQDLARIPETLAIKPVRIADPDMDVSDYDGFLEIIEGPNTSVPRTFLSRPYVDGSGSEDTTVGDVDDIIVFTAIVKVGAAPFRGLIASHGELRIEEREAAEIAWFVRGNTLYRRVRLIDDFRANVSGVNTLADLAQRKNRFGQDTFPLNTFPYPRYLYDDTGIPMDWYYLRMPTLEETLHGDWVPDEIPLTIDSEISHPDLWEQPHFFPDLQDRKSGSLSRFVGTPRHVRAGEDVVLTNVLSFDIKVWCPEEHVRDFVDLGTPGTTWAEDQSTVWTHKDNGNEITLPRTWDSWTRKYSEDYPVYRDDHGIVLPPYTEPLKAIQITIRCFDPASRVIKQVTVVHRFKE
jgi:type II secretory pathway pseudopilin PulG